MTTLREAAQQALEAMKGELPGWRTPAQERAITALRDALAQEEQEPTVLYKCTVVDDRHPNGVPFEQWVNAPQQEQEPVAMCHTWHKGSDQHAELLEWSDALEALPDGEHLLYTHPPRREWQGLTDADYDLICDNHSTLQGAARAIEAKLKEKNHD